MAYAQNFSGQVMPISKLPDDLKGGFIGNSNFILAEGEYFVECPYNKSHLVRNVKITYHVLRCRRNYEYEMKKKGKEVVYVGCPYGICPAFPRPELEYHAQRCKPFTDADFQSYEIYKDKAFQEENKRSVENYAKSVEAWKANGVLDDEDWEKEAIPGYVAGYDPRYKLDPERVLFTPSNMSKMERKDFKKKYIIPAYEEKQRQLAEQAAKKEAAEKIPFDVLYAAVNPDDE